MTRVVLLDAGPLGLLTSPPDRKGKAADCARWLADPLAADVRIRVPEITDYEVRRELLRAGKGESVARLDALAPGN